MPIAPTEHNLQRLRAALQAPPNNGPLTDEELDVNAALTGLAVSARLHWPEAKYICLTDSDQGSWACLAAVTRADDEHIDDASYHLDDDGWTSYLYDNRRHLASPYVWTDTDTIDRRNPWSGVIIDIDKILDNPPPLRSEHPALTIPEDAWDQCGDEPDGDPADGYEGDAKSRLTTTIVINGLHLHLDAYEVIDVDGEQAAIQQDDDLAAYHGAAGADGPFDTVTIFDREYVLVATPHC